MDTHRMLKRSAGVTTLLAVIIYAAFAGGPVRASGSEDAERAATPVVSRIGGSDRFDVAVNISERLFASGVSELYIASGLNFPDALSVGPAAIHWRDALLIVTKDAVPPRVAAEITRLHPSAIKVVGGENAVSRAVYDQIQSLVPTARVAMGTKKGKLSILIPAEEV